MDPPQILDVKELWKSPSLKFTEIKYSNNGKICFWETISNLKHKGQKVIIPIAHFEEPYVLLDTGYLIYSNKSIIEFPSINATASIPINFKEKYGLDIAQILPDYTGFTSYLDPWKTNDCNDIVTVELEKFDKLTLPKSGTKLYKLSKLAEELINLPGKEWTIDSGLWTFAMGISI